MSSLKCRASCVSTSDQAEPDRPARAVRPTRWTYLRASIGTSYEMTCETEGMSMPRAMRSEQTRLGGKQGRKKVRTETGKRERIPHGSDPHVNFALAEGAEHAPALAGFAAAAEITAVGPNDERLAARLAGVGVLEELQQLDEPVGRLDRFGEDEGVGDRRGGGMEEREQVKRLGRGRQDDKRFLRRNTGRRKAVSGQSLTSK